MEGSDFCLRRFRMGAPAMGSVESRDRVEAYLQLTELSRRLFDGRRQYEWKVTLGFWALLAAAIKLHPKPPLPGLLYLAVPLLFGFVWIRGVYVANENDKKMMDFYRDAAQALLSDPSYAVGKPEDKIPLMTCKWWLGFLFSWGTFFEFATSVLLAGIAYKLR